MLDPVIQQEATGCGIAAAILLMMINGLLCCSNEFEPANAP